MERFCKAAMKVGGQIPFLFATVGLALFLVACGGGGSASGESGMESGSEGMHAGEGSEGGSGGADEESSLQLMQTETFNMVRSGARLMLKYDATSQQFIGTVENTTNAQLDQVRVEIHLFRAGQSMAYEELGPTKPMDLAPNQISDIILPASGLIHVDTVWSPHAEVGTPGGGNAVGTPQPFELMGSWAVMGGVPLGIEHEGYALSAWFTDQGVAHIAASAPQHQPDMAATWSGTWLNDVGQTGDMQVTVSLGSDTQADLLLSDLPDLGNLEWQDMSVVDGRFTGTTEGYDAVGQFGGPDQVGVVGHASGTDLQSVFYGERQ